MLLHGPAIRCAAALLLGVAPAAGHAFGPDGHRIAGLAAEPYLCDRARTEIAGLTGGEPFEDLGSWADGIRGEPRWAHTAPWHYMNIEDGGSIADYRHPPEGDVLWAIQRFSAILADRARGPAQRGEALRFLVHFVVDVHQPLHVGRASDRGGNTVDVRFGDTAVNLHRFWDTDVIRLRGLSPERYAQRIAPLARALPAADGDRSPAAWAEESLALRPAVYGFDRRTGTLDAAYLEAAQAVIERRLAQASRRLAATLNGIFCGARGD